jgi:hypothetical protein
MQNLDFDNFLLRTKYNVSVLKSCTLIEYNIVQIQVFLHYFSKLRNQNFKKGNGLHLGFLEDICEMCCNI